MKLLKLCTAVFAVALAASLSVAALSGAVDAGAAPLDLKPITLSVKGEKVSSVSPVAYAIAGSGTDATSVYASLGALAPRLGLSLGWMGDTQTVRSATETVVVYTTVGKAVALVNGSEKPLSSAPVLIRGQAFVPLTDFVDFFGYEMRWDEKNRTVDVYVPTATVGGARLADEDGRQVLYVEMDRPVEYRSFTLVNPNRFVLDLKGARLGKGEKQSSGSGVVQQVRLSQFDGSTVRVVADLERLVGYDVSRRTDPERIAVSFNVAVTGAELAQVGPERLRVDATGPIEYAMRYLDDPRRVVLDIDGATLALPSGEKSVNGVFVRTLRQSQLDSGTVRVALEVPEGVVARDLTPPDAAPGRLEIGFLAEVNRAAAYPLDDSVYVAEVGSPGDNLPADVVVRAVEGGAEGRTGRALEFTLHGAALSVPYDITAAGVGPIKSVRASQADVDTVKVQVQLEPGATWQLAPPDGQGAAKTGKVRILVRKDTAAADHAATAAVGQAAATPRAAPGKNIVVLDPGHGGVDVGSIGPQGTLEKDVTTDIARRVQVALEKRGVKTQLTRPDGSVFVGLQERAAMANTLQAPALVSIHANWFAENYAKGTETYYRQGDDRSRALADAIHGRLVASLGTVDRGVKPAPGFVVLKQANVPAVLVEVAFLSNDEEEKLLVQPEYREKAAAAIAEGILAFIGDGVQAPDAAR